MRFQELEQKLILVVLGLNSLGFESKTGGVSEILRVYVYSVRTYLGRYTDVLKTPSSEMSKAWQMSLMTGGVAVAVRQMTRSALIS